MKVYFDESGQSGNHLLDLAQPFFSLGSTNIEEAEAADIIARCFPRQQADELKSQNILRRNAGKRAFLRFASEVGSRPDRFCAVKVGKRYTVIAKMVDNLIEPVMSDAGYDFYADDHASLFANAAHQAFEHGLDPAVAGTVLEAYNAFGRMPDRESLRAVEAALASAVPAASNDCAILLGMMHAGAGRFEEFHDLDGWADNNEFHVTAAVTCMGFWQDRGPGPYEVVPDESTHFFRRSERWRMMTDPCVPPQVIELGPKTLRLPIDVVSTTSARSHECASLQICDLIAGFVTRAYAPSPTEAFTAFLREAEAVGMHELTIFPIDAGQEVPDGLPRRATGPDVVDRIAMAVNARRGT